MQESLPQGHFGPQGHHLNKSCRGPLDNALYKSPQLVLSEKMLFMQIVDDKRRMSHETLAYVNSSPSAYGSGELKRYTFTAGLTEGVFKSSNGETLAQSHSRLAPFCILTERL